VNIHTNLDNFKVKSPILTVGFFDGVHTGHQKVINRLNQIAKEKDGTSVIFTLYPHPRKVLYPGEMEMPILNTLEEKSELLEKAGIEHLIIFPFTKEFSKLSACEFIESILIKQIGIQHLVVGHDHRFGREREGDVNLIRSCIEKYDIDVEQISAYQSNNEEVSSSKIRSLLQEGYLEKANDYLGYSYFVSGIVVEGFKLGRTIDFPTANIQINDKYKLIPTDGVYAAQISIDGQKYNGMLNIGVRPTVSSNHQRSIEINILDFNKDIYKKNVKLEFLKKMRNEIKFDNLEQLKNQLTIDKLQIRNFFNSIS